MVVLVGGFLIFLRSTLRLAEKVVGGRVGVKGTGSVLGTGEVLGRDAIYHSIDVLLAVLIRFGLVWLG